MLVTPGCVGYLLTDHFSRMLVIATATATGSSFVGVYVSFFLNASTGACIVLLQAAVFLLTLIFAPKHGLLASGKLRRVGNVLAVR
jgi:ABC-type Mn2+/Zn2+ transport system permease subunit